METKQLKNIIEAALLTDEEKVAACQLAKVARADFVYQESYKYWKRSLVTDRMIFS